MSDTALKDLPADITARLNADSYFSDIVVIDYRQLDILAEINKRKAVVTSKAGKLGAAVIVLPPVGSDQMPNVPVPILDIIQGIQVVETPEINFGANGTKKQAREIARRVLRVLKLYQSVGLFSPLIPLEPTIEHMDLGDMNAVGYLVQFSTREADSDTDTKVLTPDISPASGVAPQTVTLSCGTAGAAIYYTVDGSHPWSGNAAATLYAAPFQVTTAKTVRAAAYKSGSIGSNVNQVKYT